MVGSGFRGTSDEKSQGSHPPAVDQRPEQETHAATALAAGGTRALVLGGTLAGWAQYAVALGITLVLTPFVLARIGAGAYGVWLLLNQALGYSGLLDLGIHPAVVRSIAEARIKGGRDELRWVLGTALRLYAVAGMVCLFVGVLFAISIQRWFDLGGVSVETGRQTALIATLSAASVLPATAITGALKGLQRFDLASGLGLSAHLLRGVGTVVALETGAGLPGLALATLIANLAVLVGGAIALQRLTGVGTELLRSGSRRVLKRLVSIGVFSLVGTAGWQLAYGSDTVLIAGALTAVDAAHFGLAANIMIMVSALVGAFTGNLLPLASAHEASGSGDRTQATYLLGTRIALLVALPPLALFFVEGPLLLSAWLGPAVGLPTGAILRLLAIAYLPSLANAAGPPVALGMGYHRIIAGLTLSEGVIKVLLSLLFMPKFGVYGVGFATLTSSLIHQGVIWPRILCRRLQVRPLTLWTEALRGPLTTAMAVTAALLLLEALFPGRHSGVRIVTAALVSLVGWGPVVVSLVRRWVPAMAQH